MSKALRISRTFLVIMSIVLLGKGIFLVFATTGTVSGSEFGMLITIINILGFLFVWLAAFAFYIICSSKKDKSNS